MKNKENNIEQKVFTIEPFVVFKDRLQFIVKRTDKRNYRKYFTALDSVIEHIVEEFEVDGVDSGDFREVMESVIEARERALRRLCEEIRGVDGESINFAKNSS